MVDTLGQRMRAAADTADLTQEEVGAEVAERIGRRRPFSAAAVGQWYADKHKPTYQVLIAFAKLVSADLVWLQTAVGGGAGQLPREGRIVPVIAMEQAIKLPIEYFSKDTVHT